MIKINLKTEYQAVTNQNHLIHSTIAGLFHVHRHAKHKSL